MSPQTALGWPPWCVALAEPSADAGRYKLPFARGLSFLRGHSVRLEGWWQSLGGYGSAGWSRGSRGRGGTQGCLTGSVLPTGGLRVLPHGPAVHCAAHAEAEDGII